MSKFDSLKERDLVWFDRGFLELEFHRVFDKDGQEWVEGFAGNSAYRIPAQFVQTEKPIVLSLTKDLAQKLKYDLRNCYTLGSVQDLIKQIEEKLND